MGLSGLTATSTKSTRSCPPGSTREQSRQMIQTMLKGRFGLKFHHEQRDLPISTLVVGKRGFALHEVPKAGKSSRSWFSGSETGSYKSTETSMEDFAKFLTDATHRRVVDKTGLKGVYNFDLTWNTDWGDGPPQTRIDRGIVPAVERRLGLLLVDSTLPCEVLAIDQINRTPTEN